MNYHELFCQSNFSFLTSASHPEELVQQACFLGYKSIAITDECSVAGVVRAHHHIQQHALNIRLIIGSLLQIPEQSLRIILLCPTQDAYTELCRIITNARRRAPKGQYELSEWDLMSVKHCLCIWLPSGDQQADNHWGQWLSQHFSQRLWIGYQRYLVAGEHDYQSKCRQLSNTLSLPLVACGGVLMHSPERLPLHHVLTATQHGLTIDNCGYHLLPNHERSMRSLKKLKRLFDSDMLQQTAQIAQQCTFSLKQLSYQYPKELVPTGYTADSYLRALVEDGIQHRFPEGLTDDIRETIEKELNLIKEMGYAAFFLTIHDIITFARKRHILYQGRGSAANSIVCYCLHITAVDPRQIAVLFERFISKERDQPPDIDVDFEHQRREEVIQYIYQKYGHQRAALAATVITYRLKMAIRDVGKALGIDKQQLDFFIAHLNRRDKGLDWQAQLCQLGLNPKSQQSKQFLSLVNEIIGFPRHLSQHTGGFVISSGPLYELVPVENAAMPERSVIQWDKNDLESLGLLKVDILALGMLSMVRRCFNSIEQHYQRSLTLADITRMNDDPKVYRMIQQADTIGTFQIESRAQMSMLPRLKPASYYDLVIQIAIVRPGPIQGDMVHPYLLRREGKEAVDYPSPEVESVLSRTLGVPIFQEQVIKLAMVAAGFSGGEADQLRRAMAAWKKHDQLAPFEDKLIKGMTSRGYSENFAARVFAQIRGFGDYGFPESHAASFAVISYASCWLKYYYPAVFYCELLNSQPMGFYSPSQLLQDAKRHAVSIHPICVVHSQWEHTLVPHHKGLAIQLGFSLIRGIHHQDISQLIEHRQQRPFQSINDVQSLPIGRHTIDKLASANALRSFSNNRYQARWELMENTQALPLFQQLASSDSLLNIQPSEASDMKEDYHTTGVTLDTHPITLLEANGYLPAFTRCQELKHKHDKAVVTIIGLVTGRQSPGTAGGVSFFTLEDDTGNINVIIWQATARAQKSAYMAAKLLKVTGVLQKEGDIIHVVAGRLDDISQKLTELT